MLIVLEGTDGAGKGTLAKEIVRQAGTADVQILHKGPPDKRHILEQYELDLEQPRYRLAATSPAALVICDRWHVGEMIYGPLKRGKSLLNQAQLVHIEMLLETLGAVKVILTATPEELKARHEDSPDPHVTDWLEAYDNQLRYENFASRFNWQVVRSSSLPTVMLARRLVAEAKGRVLLDSWKLSQFCSYIGPARPAVLLVGDRPNKAPWPRIRAFTPITRQGPSAALLETLYRQRAWKAVGLVNQADVNLDSLWMALGSPHVKALGSAAAKAMERTYIPTARWEHTQHPQYVRRFQHVDWDGYVKELVTIHDHAMAY